MQKNQSPSGAFLSISLKVAVIQKAWLRPTNIHLTMHAVLFG
ncbi:hypothetical protein BLL52_0076 [Rhodoferax antarcticus ANT.BR]|uniref:Uncharacterized protein n=1 Tax=Rhodoferax antarcticus ANT.BR TaxID=1111071 RepID=A0A1Q8YKP7_9BURK|nr:hypothetical protein BLL52_0076 [Rhodoferax antarcticus ANT.BR]